MTSAIVWCTMAGMCARQEPFPIVRAAALAISAPKTACNPSTTANFLYLDTDRTAGLPFDTQTGQRFGELTANCI